MTKKGSDRELADVGKETVDELVNEKNQAVLSDMLQGINECANRSSVGIMEGPAGAKSVVRFNYPGKVLEKALAMVADAEEAMGMTAREILGALRDADLV